MSRKVQITLVGGQTMPVYLGIIEMQPDVIVLVHSSDTIAQAQRIAEEYPDKTTLLQFEPMDMPVIMDSAKELLDEYKDDDVIVNITGGSKPWGFAFTMLAQGKKNVQLIYVDQNCVFYNYTTNEKWQSTQSLDMDQLMRLNGQSPKSHNFLSDYDEDDMKTLSRVKCLRNNAPMQFNLLTIPDKKWRKSLIGGYEGKHAIDGGSYVEWNKSQHWVRIFINKKNGKQYEELFDSPNVMHIVFNSGWFEFEVAKIISTWQYAKEVWLNVVYPYRAGQPKNEIDVVVNTGVKLLMIECKTQIFDNTDIDKFSTAVKNYGGMGCKALFITESKMKDTAKEKCADSKVLTFCMKDYNSKGAIRTALYTMLNKEIMNINAK